MINFYKQIENGYIVGIGTNGPDTVTAISKEEYNELLSIIHNKPIAPDGSEYMLRADTLEWELVELPPEPEPGDVDAGEEDYVQVLEDLGVRFG